MKKYIQAIIVLLTFFQTVYIKAETANIQSPKTLGLDERCETGNIIDLSGKWQFCYGKRLTARQMNDIPQSEKYYIDVPSNWKGQIFKGQTIPTFGIATYYLRIIPKKKGSLKNHKFGLYLGSVAYAYELWINDRLVKKVGHISETKESFKPMYLPGSTTFDVRSDTLDIIFHVSNFFYPHYSGISRGCYFGNIENINLFTLKQSISSIFILSFLFILLLIQVIFCFINKHEKSHVYVALLCFVFFMKFALDSNITVFHIIRNADFELLYRIWMMTLICTPILFALAKIRYPAELNKTVLKVVDAFYFLVFIFIAFFPLQIVLSSILIILYITFALIFYLLFVFILTIKNKRGHSVPNAFSFIIMIATFINDLIFATNQTSFWFISQIGVFVYVLTQSVLEFLDYSKSYRSVIRLSSALAEANDGLLEIVEKKTEYLQKTNDELSKINKQQKFLISVITSDLTHSFNKVKTLLNSLLNCPDLSDAAYQNLLKINATTGKVSQVFGNILDWIRVQIPYNPDKKTITNLSLLVDNLKVLFSDQLENKNITLQADIDDSFLFRCDENHLNIILRNLVSNAIKFSYSGGSIEIREYGKNGRTVIEVTDHGIGISPDKLPSIFDSEKNNKRVGTSGEKGSGIGLIIVNEFVKINNGFITCSSEPEVGTTFSIYFNF